MKDFKSMISGVTVGMKSIDRRVVMDQLISLQNEIKVLLDSEMNHFLENIEFPTRELINYYYSLGGKQLRPALFLSVAHAFNADENIAPHALMIELIHTMSLYHDDVIDDAKERRGAPTAHVKWDVPSAIVGGDILHSVIHGHILRSISNNRIKYPELSIKFLQDLIYVVELKIGSSVIDEMFWSSQVDMPTIDQSLEITSGKTAPLFAFSASAGSYLANQGQIVADNMHEMGQRLGYSFQLLDDVSDYFSNNKDIGGDLREDKKTPILVLAYQKDPKFVDKFRRREDLNQVHLQQFRTKFKDEFFQILNWAKDELNLAKKYLRDIPSNSGKERIESFFSLLKLQIKQFEAELL